MAELHEIRPQAETPFPVKVAVLLLKETRSVGLRKLSK